MAPYYMLRGTFMAVPTLHAYTNIHGCTYITCPRVHSCSELHYMRRRTFMDGGTLHAEFNIHRLTPKPED
jgi:hypothetical protein